MRRPARLPEADDEIIGPDRFLPHLELLQTVVRRPHHQAFPGRDVERQIVGRLHVLDVFVRHVRVVLEIEAVGVHGRRAGRLGSGHAVGDHRVAHQTDERCAARLFRRGPVARGIVLDDAQTLDRIRNPAVGQPPGPAQPDRRPRRHPDVRPGPLRRRRRDQRIRIRKMLALEREPLAAPTLADDVDGLLGARRSLGNRNAERVEVLRLVADSDAQHQATLGGQVDHRAVFGHVYRMVERHEQHAGADLDPLGLHADQPGQQQRIGQIAVLLLMVFGQEAAVPAAGLRGLGLGRQFVDHARHVRPGRRVLSTRQITNG